MFYLIASVVILFIFDLIFYLLKIAVPVFVIYAILHWVLELI